MPITPADSTDPQAKLLVLLNHHLTALQAEEARTALGVERIIEAPDDVKILWRSIPPDLAEIGACLAPVRAWLAETAAPGDYLFVQGDLGATYLIVEHALAAGLRPVYATTARRARERRLADGAVQTTRTFTHHRFRRFGV
jgi:hypothetical protein